MIYVLNGPNLGRLGTREPHIYGSATYADLVQICQDAAKRLDLEVQVRQTDAEFEMIRWLHEAVDEGADVVINPGGWSHYNIAVRDACALLGGRLIEVHISNIHRRDPIYHHSLVSTAATAVIAGLGANGYVAAVQALGKMLAKG